MTSTDLSERYDKYVLLPHTSTSEDGRFGRCWYHVFETEGDRNAGKRLFSLVMLVHYMYKDRGKRSLEKMALDEARKAVHALIDSGEFQKGMLYRKILGTEGFVREDKEELRDAVYK